MKNVMIILNLKVIFIIMILNKQLIMLQCFMILITFINKENKIMINVILLKEILDLVIL